MRPGPLIEAQCPFPECVAEEDHGGDHQFADFRNGMEVELNRGFVVLRPSVYEQFHNRSEEQFL
jgi:hypothetical protein